MVVPASKMWLCTPTIIETAVNFEILVYLDSLVSTSASEFPVTIASQLIASIQTFSYTFFELIKPNLYKRAINSMN